MDQPAPSNVDAEQSLAALDAAMSWFDQGAFYYQKELVLGRYARGLEPSARRPLYDERIHLIEMGLQRGALQPYKLAHLADLRFLAGREKDAYFLPLELSLTTGAYVHALFVPRFKSLYAFWPKLTEAERKSVLPAVRVAYRVGTSALIRFARKRVVARNMIRQALKSEPRELLHFARELLRRN